MKQDVVIVGGGLAGLAVAERLHQAGLDAVLLEARDRLGGRILSLDAAGNPSTDGFDLGPSWFWPQSQMALGDLVTKLGLETVEQHSKGDVLFHRMSREQPRRFSPVGQDQITMRIVGGTGALIAALADCIPVESVRLNSRVTRIDTAGSDAAVSFIDNFGEQFEMRASRVVFALPPRLLQATIEFVPKLDALTAERWRATPTWMAPHAKFFAVYQHAFWRDEGLSGTAQSLVGPMVEIHDATTKSGKPALFGFLGVPASARAQLDEVRMMEACLAQLAELFGPEASKPIATLFKDWARDPLTATQADHVASGHPPTASAVWVPTPLRNKVLLAGSETSPTESGYLAGAVEAAKLACEEILHG